MALSTRNALEREVKKLISRHNAMCRAAALDRRRYERRSGLTAAIPPSNEPAHWAVHPHFNPYYVNSRLDSISHALRLKLQSGTYEPNPILLVDIPKPSGGTRQISLLTVPDAAVSYSLATRLVERNAHFFTSYTYAYRRDRNAHHAIQHLMSELRGASRLFVLEFDFSRYFDSIEHDYLMEMLDRHFLSTARERALILRLLTCHRAAGVPAYLAGAFTQATRGIPQGSTLSLFLANVACHELDSEIEHEGAVFARYADDTVVLCDSYEKADRCARHLMDHGKRSGTEVNFSKSEGVRLLACEGDCEMKTTHSVTFLAHSLSSTGVGISPKSISRMKRTVAQIIQRHLLLQPSRGHVDPDRFGVGFRDWDLVTCLNELRRYAYGRLTEASLSSALSGAGQFNITRCALSFYPTVDAGKAEVLKDLDGWLADVLTRAYTKRTRLLTPLGIAVPTLTKEDIISGDWYEFPSVPNETRLPSFFRSWLYVQRCARIFGLSRFPSPVYEYT